MYRIVFLNDFIEKLQRDTGAIPSAAVEAVEPAPAPAGNPGAPRGRGGLGLLILGALRLLGAH